MRQIMRLRRSWLSCVALACAASAQAKVELRQLGEADFGKMRAKSVKVVGGSLAVVSQDVNEGVLSLFSNDGRKAASHEVPMKWWGFNYINESSEGGFSLAFSKHHMDGEGQISYFDRNGVGQGNVSLPQLLVDWREPGNQGRTLVGPQVFPDGRFLTFSKGGHGCAANALVMKDSRAKVLWTLCVAKELYPAPFRVGAQGEMWFLAERAGMNAELLIVGADGKALRSEPLPAPHCLGRGYRTGDGGLIGGSIYLLCYRNGVETRSSYFVALDQAGRTVHANLVVGSGGISAVHPDRNRFISLTQATSADEPAKLEMFRVPAIKEASTALRSDAVAAQFLPNGHAVVLAGWDGDAKSELSFFDEKLKALRTYPNIRGRALNVLAGGVVAVSELTADAANFSIYDEKDGLVYSFGAPGKYDYFEFFKLSETRFAVSGTCTHNTNPHCTKDSIMFFEVVRTAD